MRGNLLKSEFTQAVDFSLTLNSIVESNSSVSRRIDEMAEDVEKQLISHLQVKQFALQLDKSTLRDNEAILLAYRPPFFHELCKKNGEELERLVLHTEFPCLASVSNDLQDEDLALYGEYMENMHKNMQIRFSDLLMMVIPTWVSIPFEVNVADIDISLQEPLIELQSDEIMRAKFKDVGNKLDIVKRGDLRLSLTSMEPDIKKLAEQHQPQGSH
ncbi:uncharacterized protein [Palaemon carinicauda]|uniref:uncharacterized protein n=1 Tax=Palaemon carinicauda TaxID=392227 RepID=UPI0035B67C34